MKHKVSKMKIAVGDVVLIKGESKNRGKWKMGVVNTLFEGKDNVIRAVKLRAGKSFMERPIQLLYPLELSCDTSKVDDDNIATSTLSVKAKEYRPRRTAAAIADIKMHDILSNCDESD